MSKKTIKDYTDELKDAGLITITQERIGKPYNYHIEELHMVAALVHSEAVYLAIEPFKRNRWQVVDAVLKYAETRLFAQACIAPIANQIKINEWFAEYFSQWQAGIEKVEAPVAVGGRVILEDQRLGTGNKPMGIPPKDLKQTASVEEKPAKKMASKVSFTVAPVEDWNTHHFISYFEHLYLEKFKLPSMNTMQERGAMARVLGAYEDKKDVLKNKMDIYMAQDFFMPKGVSGFCSSMTQSFIDQFMATGTFQHGKQSKIAPVEETKEAAETTANRFEERNKRLRGENV